MFHLVMAQWKKTKHTIIRPMIFCLPIMYSFLISFYCTFTQAVSTEEKNIFFFLLLSIAVLFFSAIIVSFFIQLDKNASNFGNELRIGISRRKLISSKILFFVALILTVEFVALVVFTILEFFFQMDLVSVITMGLFLLTSIVFLLPTILIYVFFAYRFNFTGTLMVSVVIVLSSILMGTTELGNQLWRFLPWIWPVKIVSSILPNTLYLTGDVQAKAIEILVQTLIFSVVVSAFLFLLLNIWYNQWEGKGSLEE